MSADGAGSRGQPPLPQDELAIRTLQRFRRLEELWLYGHAKDIGVVGELTLLRKLSLRAITLPSLDVFRALAHLDRLELKLGGTKNLDALPAIGRLRAFEAFLVRGLSDIGPVARIPTLQMLHLDALEQVTKLPSFRPATALRRVHFRTMKGIRGLGPLAEAPNLEELAILGAPQLQPADFRPFIAHPKLRRISIELGSAKKNEAVREILPLGLIAESPRWLGPSAG